jgi:hypothetical protein
MNPIVKIKLELAQLRESGLELGFFQTAASAIAKYAPRIVKTTKQVVPNKLKNASSVAKSFFNRGTAQGRAAFKVARQGAAAPIGAGVKSGKKMLHRILGDATGPNRTSLGQVANFVRKNPGKIGLAVGTAGAIRAHQSPEPNGEHTFGSNKIRPNQAPELIDSNTLRETTPKQPKLF